MATSSTSKKKWELEFMVDTVDLHGDRYGPVRVQLDDESLLLTLITQSRQVEFKREDVRLMDPRDNHRLMKFQTSRSGRNFKVNLELNTAKGEEELYHLKALLDTVSEPLDLEDKTTSSSTSKSSPFKPSNGSANDDKQQSSFRPSIPRAIPYTTANSIAQRHFDASKGKQHTHVGFDMNLGGDDSKSESRSSRSHHASSHSNNTSRELDTENTHHDNTNVKSDRPNHGLSAAGAPTSRKAPVSGLDLTSNKPTSHPGKLQFNNLPSGPSRHPPMSSGSSSVHSNPPRPTTHNSMNLPEFDKLDVAKPARPTNSSNSWLSSLSRSSKEDDTTPSMSKTGSTLSIKRNWDAHGIWNIGNSCYINSTIQALISLAPFVHDLGSDELWSLIKDDVGLKSAFRAVAAIVDEAKDPNRKTPLNPARLKLAVARRWERFRNNAQQDAHEFFVSLLAQLEHEIMPYLNKARRKQQIEAASKNPKKRDRSSSPSSSSSSSTTHQQKSNRYTGKEETKNGEKDVEIMDVDSEELEPRVTRSSRPKHNTMDSVNGNEIGPFVDDGIPYSKRKTLLCPSKRNFAGIIELVIKCEGCEHVSRKPESLRCLTLDIFESKKEIVEHMAKALRHPATPEEPWDGEANHIANLMSQFGDDKTPSIRDLLRAAFAPEKIERRCEKCCGKLATAHRELIQLPRVLVIHLKRFAYDTTTGDYRKLPFEVLLNSSLNIESYCAEGTLCAGPIPFIPNESATISRSRDRLKDLQAQEDALKTELEKERAAYREHHPPTPPPEIPDEEDSLSIVSATTSTLTTNKTGTMGLNSSVAKMTGSSTSMSLSSAKRTPPPIDDDSQLVDDILNSRSFVVPQPNNSIELISGPDSLEEVHKDSLESDDDGVLLLRPNSKTKKPKFGEMEDEIHSTRWPPSSSDIVPITSPLHSPRDMDDDSDTGSLPNRVLDLPSALDPGLDHTSHPFGPNPLVNGGWRKNQTGGFGGSRRGGLKGGQPPKVMRHVSDADPDDDFAFDPNTGIQTGELAEMYRRTDSEAAKDDPEERRAYIASIMGKRSPVSGPKQFFPSDEDDNMEDVEEMDKSKPQNGKRDSDDVMPFPPASMDDATHAMFTLASRLVNSGDEMLLSTMKQVALPQLSKLGDTRRKEKLNGTKSVQDQENDRWWNASRAVTGPKSKPSATGSFDRTSTSSSRPSSTSGSSTSSSTSRGTSAPASKDGTTTKSNFLSKPSSTVSADPISLDDEDEDDDIKRAIAASKQDAEIEDQNRLFEVARDDAASLAYSTYNVSGIIDPSQEMVEFEKDDYDGDECAPKAPSDGSPTEDPPRPPPSCQYFLQSFVHHLGAFSTSGHYTTDTLESDTCDFRRFDDSSSYFHNYRDTLSRSTPSAYLLFYVHEDIIFKTHPKLRQRP